jgi:hypothetical protein
VASAPAPAALDALAQVRQREQADAAPPLSGEWVVPAFTQVAKPRRLGRQVLQLAQQRAGLVPVGRMDGLVQRQLLGVAPVQQALLRSPHLQRWPLGRRQTPARVAIAAGHGAQPLHRFAVRAPAVSRLTG